MHPVDKRNRNFVVIITIFALIFTTFCLIRNLAFIFTLIFLVLVAFLNTMQLKHRLIFVVVLLAISSPVFLLIDHLLPEKHAPSSIIPFDHSVSVLLVSAGILIVPLVFSYFYFEDAVLTASNQKNYYKIIDHFPHLICRNHFTRTEEYSTFGYKGVRCRIGKSCLKNGDIQMTIKLIGLIGIIENGKLVSNDYYVTLWDHRSRKIRYGDYDAVEIHESAEFKDYDFVITKLITFFYNEIDRYKPLSEVNIRIIGHPPLSENTRRMLHKHFMNVEYLPS